uniref:Unannotated protein n=1 Tax=freshwater metagenome TaxID=449393 RepID=A0A6J5ZLA5_9ZZZZ
MFDNHAGWLIAAELGQRCAGTVEVEDVVERERLAADLLGRAKHAAAVGT